MIKRVMSLTMILVIGFVGYIALAEAANAESKTLREWGVPNYYGCPLDGYIEWRDATDVITGAETKLEWFKVKKTLVGVYSITINYRKLEYYVVMVDNVNNPKAYEGFVDLHGKGMFTRDYDGKNEKVPDWVMKEYKESLISYSVYTNKYSRTYHKGFCPKLNLVDLIKFDSSQEVRNSGGKPCEDCNP